MLKVLLTDGRGNANHAKVNGEGEMSVVVHPHPPRDEEIIALPFRERFADSAGSTNMAVNGGTTAVTFSINARAEYDIYVKYISVVIGDGGTPNLNSYGSLGALANGVRWTWESQDLGEIELHDGIKTNLEWLRTGNDSLGFGDGVNALLADVSGAGEKSYLPSIDLGELFGLVYGVRLRKNTKDKFSLTVRDNLTGLSTHDAIAYGLQM